MMSTSTRFSLCLALLFAINLVIVVLLLIMMFVLGLIIGRHTVISETKTTAVHLVSRPLPV